VLTSEPRKIRVKPRPMCDLHTEDGCIIVEMKIVQTTCESRRWKCPWPGCRNSYTEYRPDSERDVNL